MSRQPVLKGGAAIAGTTAVTGFPTVWAQTIKDITLNHTGMSYSTIIDIARQASQDLGFKVEMSVVDHPGLTNRMVNDPNSIDIADSEIWQTKVYVPQGVTQAVDSTRSRTVGQGDAALHGGQVRRQGSLARGRFARIEFMYRDAADGTTFHDGQTEWATFLPGVYNADTLGIRPDLVGRDDHKMGRPVVARLQGQGGDPEHPDDRHHGRDHGDRVRRHREIRRQGQPDAGRADQDDRQADRAEEGGPFPGAVEHLRRVGEPDGRRRGGDPVDVVAGGDRGAARKGIKCVYQPLKEGYRGWGNGLALMGHLEGMKLDAAYEYLNWYISGWVGGFIAKQGYYIVDAGDGQEVPDRERVGLLLRGQAGDRRHHQPDRREDQLRRRHPRRRLLRGALLQGRVWNNLMDQAEFLFAKWNEFNAA